jgi:acyl carrier protein
VDRSSETAPSVQQRLALIVRAHLRAVGPESPISADTPMRDLGLDSLAAVDLLFAVEQAFEISFPDSLLTENTFATLGTLQSAVERVLGENVE